MKVTLSDSNGKMQSASASSFEEAILKLAPKFDAYTMPSAKSLLTVTEGTKKAELLLYPRKLKRIFHNQYARIGTGKWLKLLETKPKKLK